MSVAWETSDGTLFGATRDSSYFLIVERLPDADRWDWEVWQRALPEHSRSGTASSATISMIEAEFAIVAMDRGHGVFEASAP